MERVALFVDVQNIYYTVKQHYGRHFDYGAFWSHATRNRRVVRARAYAIDRNDSKQRGFQQVLRDIGFDVRLKPFIQRRDGSAKGDWDVGIALDMIDAAEIADTVMLASGDGDFEPVVKRLREQNGVSVEVCGVRELTASSLVRAATYFIPIEYEFLLPA